VLIVLFTQCACDRDDSIHVYQAPKDAPPATAPSRANGPWTIPDGWQQQPDQPMRVATFKGGDVEVTITRFGSESFANLMPNINRWRNQVGLEPLAEEKDIKSEPGTVGKSKAQIFDFAGQSKRLRVAVALSGPSVWYFKISGPTAAVEQQLKSFDEFLRSVRLPDEQPVDRAPQ